MRWVLLVASLFVALLLGESVARWLVDDVYLQHRLRAGGVLVPYEPDTEADLLSDEFRVRFRINGFGYRDRLERRAERTPGVHRIVLLGDSFAVGWGVEFEETFGDRFERATGIEVVNVAKSGGCPLLFVPQARHVRERFTPDWLLVQLFDNDPDDNAEKMEGFELSLGERFVSLAPAIRPLETLERRLSRAFDESVIRNRLRRLTRLIRGKAVHGTPFVKPGAKPSRRILSREEAIAVHGVDHSADRPLHHPFTFLDPAQLEAWQAKLDWNALLLDQLLEEANAGGVPVAIVYIPVYDVFLREPAPNPLAESVREVAERRGAVWIDATAAFAARPRPVELYYAYDGHLNPDGHAAVAELLEQVLAPRIRAAQMTGERAAL